MLVKKFRVYRLDELADPGSRAFTLSFDGTEVDGFVVRRGDCVTAFINSCPHTGASLNWSPYQFLDVDGEFIQCGLHGALFRPNDGLCVRGPCVGQSLESLQVSLKDGIIWVSFD